MSFANEVRNELARIIPVNVCCQKAELIALLGIRAELRPNKEGDMTLFTTVENASLARKVYTLLKQAYGVSSSVHILQKRRFKKSRVYRVETSLQGETGAILQKDLGPSETGFNRQVKWNIVKKNCCKRAFIRGAFLSSGFINRPEGNYHLEIVLNDSRLASDVQRIMRRLGLDARLTERKNNPLIYIKEGETIVDFLRLVEASHALLDFENVRIIKSMRNQVNRQVNCETANLAKTVDASVRQVEMIERILAQQGIKAIPPKLRELALLRLEHPDHTLKELGMLLEPPLTKSGVAYRMSKLERLADDMDREE